MPVMHALPHGSGGAFLAWGACAFMPAFFAPTACPVDMLESCLRCSVFEWPVGEELAKST